MRNFPFYKQHDQMDCGPTCLRIIAKFYGRSYSIQRLRTLCNINKLGVSLLGISEAAEKLGFRSLGAKITLKQLDEAEMPCLLHWRQRHFVILYKVTKGKYYISDPAFGLAVYNRDEFSSHWLVSKTSSVGVVLFVVPTSRFYENDEEESVNLTWTTIFKYSSTHSKLIFQLFFGLAIGSLIQLIGPFLTQAIVDTGISTRNMSFVNLILVAQLLLFVGSMSVGFIRSWIMLHITTRVNVSILTDFLAKLMRLPISFFDTKRTGDIMQRMSDHKRIEGFLTGTAVNTLFSLVNVVLYGVVIAYYNSSLLYIFIISSLLYTGWVSVFMRRRRALDQKRFDISSKNQSNMVELITGIQEIKLHNCEHQKRWQWENLQASLFKFSTKSLALNQYQQAGANFINQGKNILITYLSAKAVVEGDLTLGGMMAVQFMAGQLNAPIEQLIGLIQGYQDAKISLERFNEVHGMDDEESIHKQWVTAMPKDKSITIANLSFSYPGAGSEPVLRNISLKIPEGKTTAIVGMSGSGKTTMLKLLLRFYSVEEGNLRIGETSLNQISFKEWRRQCGMVMQDGFIFSDTIAGNIAVGDEYTDYKRLINAVKIANIHEFIEELPLGLNTLIGAGGNGLSQGQKQRLLIARAIYKDPHYLFFDEATNSLDANNEKTIMNCLAEFCVGRTVIVVAHRLSTVRYADKIIVLNKGKVVEQGTHEELTLLKGDYYYLVKNQLELGS